MLTNSDLFPQRLARTARFTYGSPRSFTVSGDGSRVLFLRSSESCDPVNSLWTLDVDTGIERVVADPRCLLSDTSDRDLPAAEQAMRERLRETGSGLVTVRCFLGLWLLLYCYGEAIGEDR